MNDARNTYLDHASGEPLHPAAREVLERALDRGYAVPRRLHRPVVGELDRLGFAVASGAACTSSSLEPSHVLAAMGALTHGNVRVSLGRDTAAADVHRLSDELPGLVERLRARTGVC